jgi:predicted cobalt transporter CbtA
VVARQVWWLATVLCSGSGLALLAFASGRWWRWLGIPLLILPHLVGAPHTGEPLPPQLAELAPRFVATTLAVNLGFWLLLGAVSGWWWPRHTPPPAGQ